MIISWYRQSTTWQISSCLKFQLTSSISIDFVITGSQIHVNLNDIVAHPYTSLFSLCIYQIHISLPNIPLNFDQYICVHPSSILGAVDTIRFNSIEQIRKPIEFQSLFLEISVDSAETCLNVIAHITSVAWTWHRSLLSMSLINIIVIHSLQRHDHPWIFVREKRNRGRLV